MLLKKQARSAPKAPESVPRSESVVGFSTGRVQPNPTLSFAEPSPAERADLLEDVRPSVPPNPVDGENPIVADLLEVDDQVGSAEQLETKEDYPKPKRFFERSTSRAAPSSDESTTPSEMWDGVAKAEAVKEKPPSAATVFRQLRAQAAWANGHASVLTTEQRENLIRELKEQPDGDPVLALTRSDQRLEGAVIAGDYLNARTAMPLHCLFWSRVQVPPTTLFSLQSSIMPSVNGAWCWAISHRRSAIIGSPPRENPDCIDSCWLM